jgi:hypothetical protein
VVRLRTEAINPLAEKVCKSQAGTLRKASISATPKEDHWGDDETKERDVVLYFDESELLEWSIFQWDQTGSDETKPPMEELKDQ